ncbi:uncharacterized protein isoform X2 [Rhodnius prolixus]
MPIRSKMSPSQLNRSHSTSSLTHCSSVNSSTASSGRVKEGALRRSRSEARIVTASQTGSSTSGITNNTDGEASRLTVGVRVRPLHPREHGNVVYVHENEVSVASEMGSIHKFNYDHCFSSSGNYTASQCDVFESMVRPLLETAFQGYNACLFAYGQTGSGKTYSMMGPLVGNTGLSEQSGIIPRFCCELLKQATLRSEGSSSTASVVTTPNRADDSSTTHHPSTVSTTVEISYLEVYNEKIHDLLVPSSTALRVREHPMYGPYVVDLSKQVINSIEDFQKWLDYGNKKRATAATEMNDKSSRSHTLFTVILTQTFLNVNKDGNWTHDQTRRSQINLVDLAGSERIAHSVASSDRIREGVSINRSLLTLGKVMSALVERRGFVPYRESVLTWLLKDSLGGNSRTSMLATISPCSSHLEETLSTLRYASQARSIVNTVRVNEGPQDKIIRELRAEVERLNVEVEKNRIRDIHLGRSESADIECASIEEMDKLREEAKETKVQLDMINKELARYQQQMTNLTQTNSSLAEQLLEKDKHLEESKAQIDTLNKELKPLKALLSATQAELQNNFTKVEEMNQIKAHIEMLTNELHQSRAEIDKTKAKLEKKLQTQENNTQLLNRKEEEIQRLKSENDSLKDYVCKTREELLNMQALIEENKMKLDDGVNYKEKELHLLKVNNESLKNDLNQARIELNRAQAVLNNDYQKLLKENTGKQELVEEITEELGFLKDENRTLKDQLNEALSEFQAAKNNLKQKYDQLDTECLKKKEEMNDRLAEIEKLNDHNKLLRNNLLTVNEQLVTLQKQLMKLKENDGENLKLIKKHVDEIEALKTENHSLNTNLTSLYQKMKDTQDQIEEEFKNKESNKIETEKIILEKNEEIKQLKSKNQSLSENLTKTWGNLHVVNVQLDQYKEKEKSVQENHITEINKSVDELKKLKIDYEKLKDEMKKTHLLEAKANAEVEQLRKEIAKVIQEKDDVILKYSKENEVLKTNQSEIERQFEENYGKLNENCEKLVKEKNEIYKVIDEKIEQINTLKEDNELLKKQQSAIRDELLKALSIIEQKSRKLELANTEVEQLNEEKRKVIGKSQTKIKQLEESLEAANEKLKVKTSKITDLEQQLQTFIEQMKTFENDKKTLEEHLSRSEQVKQNLQSELNWIAGERTFTEYQLEESRCKDKMISDKEEKISYLEDKYEKSRDEQDGLRKELSELKQNLSLSVKNENVLQSEIISHKRQVDNLQTQLKNAQKLNEELMEEKLTIVKVMEKQFMDQEELGRHKEVLAQNASLKKDLAFTKEKLAKNANKIDKLKKKITDLEDLLKKIIHDKILIHQKEASFKNAVMMKDVEVYGFITDNLYPHHWEHLTRKARDYTEKFKIPYEFERGNDCMIVRHLMLSARTTLNHFQFNQWLEKIEENNFWSREMDKDWPWEVDFKDYYTSVSDITFGQTGVSDKTAINIGISKSKCGFVDPIIWRDAMVRRHVRGIREDVDALIVHFSSSEDSLVYSILSRLKAVADRLEEVTLHRTIK